MSISEDAISAALELHHQGRRAEALAAYADILAADPDEPTALYLAALCNGEMGRLEEGIGQLERLSQLRPAVVEAHLALANLRHLADQPAGALEAYRHAVALAPEREDANAGLVALLRSLGRIGEAAAAAQAWTRQAPGRPPRGWRWETP